jgi:hypothetical protein
MTKIEGVSEEHTVILTEYLAFLEKQLYTITEYCDDGKYHDFEDVLEDIISYYVDFKKYAVHDEAGMEEWIYMLPNLTMYSFMGFLAGVKNKRNIIVIDKVYENVLMSTMEAIGLISDSIQDKSEVK